MSGLYQQFLTLVLVTTVALLSTFLFYSPNVSYTSVDLRNAINRAYICLFRRVLLLLYTEVNRFLPRDAMHPRY